MTPYCWDVVLLGWMIVWLGIRIGSNGWSLLKWLGSTWKQQLTEVLSWPNTAQPVFIKVSALALSVNNTDWMEIFFVSSLSSLLFVFVFFQVNVELPWIADVFPARVAVALAHKPLKCHRRSVRAKLNNQDQVLSSLSIITWKQQLWSGSNIKLWVMIYTYWQSDKMRKM